MIDHALIVAVVPPVGGIPYKNYSSLIFLSVFFFFLPNYLLFHHSGFSNFQCQQLFQLHEPPMLMLLIGFENFLWGIWIPVLGGPNCSHEFVHFSRRICIPWLFLYDKSSISLTAQRGGEYGEQFLTHEILKYSNTWR